jgi:hypothetical protein
MKPKITRPATVLGERTGRQAGGWKSFGDASSSFVKTASEQEQAAAAASIAWTDIFVSRLGRVGYWIRQCPACGFEHAHGGFPLFDPRLELGWRSSHCHQGGHVSGLLMRRGSPLALMLCADRVPIVYTHSEVR